MRFVLPAFGRGALSARGSLGFVRLLAAAVLLACLVGAGCAVDSEDDCTRCRDGRCCDRTDDDSDRDQRDDEAPEDDSGASEEPSAPPDEPPAAVCGDGQRDPGEDCDGNDLGGASCRTRGFNGGILYCWSDCTYDTGGCWR